MARSVRIDDFAPIFDEWEGILPSCSTDTVFVTPLWQSIWWRHFGEGAELHILSVRNDEHERLGIAPLMLKGDVLSFMGDTDLFDYHDFLVPRGKEADFYPTLWDGLMEMDWRELVLRSLPEGSPTLSYLPALVERTGLELEVEEEDVSPIAALPSNWEDYLAGLARKQRHELRRKLRRLERADDARQSICESPESHPDCMEDFFRLACASSADKAAFLTPERQRFFVDVAIELAPRGIFKLYFLEVNGTRVASCICFDHAGSYLLYNSGYDPNYSSLSVGLLNKALCIREAIEKGRHSFEFLRGSERYKYDLGGNNRVVYRIVIRR